jgi:hypothetical protein
LRINGSNFSSVNQLQLLTELNLKEGQKVIGRVISLSTDEALLEIAGRPIQAKIEGNPPPAGSTQTFLVNTDEQGRVILKVLQNPSETSSENLKGNSVSLKADPDPEAANIRKSIVSALTKDGLPPTNENVDKVARYLQDFQAKYQQPLNPKVFTFIMAQKWPVTPATVLASWVHQDPEARDVLWDKLQDSLPEQETAGFQAKLVVNMQSNVPEIADKLKSLVGLKLQGFLDKLSELLQQSKSSSQPNTNSSTNTTPSKILLPNELKAQLLSTIKNELTAKPKPEQQPATDGIQQSRVDSKSIDSKLQKATTNKGVLLNQAKSDSEVTIVKGQATTANVKDVLPEKTIEPHQEKIGSILDQNISINKAILKETAVNGSSNLIPLLVNDSQSTIHECLVQWKEEKSSNNDAANDQVVYMTIPTDNMGDIKLALRIGSGGTRINLRVNSEEVRKYFMQHTTDLKTDISKENTMISVNLNENEDLCPSVRGVDLWM